MTATNTQLYKLPPRPNVSPQAFRPTQQKNHKKTRAANWFNGKWLLVFTFMCLLLIKGCTDRATLKQTVTDTESKLESTVATLRSTKTDVQQLSKEIAEAESAKRLAVEAAEKGHTKLQAAYLGRLLQFSDFFVSDNPAMATRILTEALTVAKDEKLDDQPIIERQKRMIPAKRLPEDSTVTLVNREDHATSTILQFDVRDARGTFVTGLVRGDIELTCSGHAIHPIRIEQCSIATGTCYVSTLLDCSGSMAGPAFDELKHGAKMITDCANPPMVRVIRFASDVTEASPWSTDRYLHARAIDSLTANGSTLLVDGLEKNFNDLVKLDGLRLTVLFTDGLDKSGKSIADRDRIIARYKEYGLPVHVLVLDRGEIDADLLRRLASETGGSYQLVSSSKQLMSSFQAISERLKQPVYRLTALGPLDTNNMSLTVGGKTVSLVAQRP